ncbi:hypothetical protein Acsp07_31750 [Actinomycetospora sp. NBRC 106378]|nr:hypothetical protein Acsp07_31750 [Actinomycetospora sp. NBRC 106378]
MHGAYTCGGLLHPTVMIATVSGHDLHSSTRDPGPMADDTTRDEIDASDATAALEAIARRGSVANPRRTRR